MRRAHPGQALLLVVLLMTLLLSLIGVMVDGGILLVHRRELQNTADAAARAGAGWLDEGAYRSSGGRRVVLHPVSARAEAERYLDLKDTSGRVSVGREKVTVVATQDVDLAFLEMFGFRTVRVRARAEATLRHGVGGPEG